jgi:aminoglycoside phosphotransferase (APT) family kinase protein
MSDERFAIDEALVRRLVATQFPHWADLPVRRVAADGWDNSTFHLGAAMKVRLPNAPSYASQAEKELTWLPRIAPALPLPIPSPLAIGEPGEGYPLRWSVYGWLPGETAFVAPIPDRTAFAREVAAFLVALWDVDTTGAPVAGQHNFHRGGELAVYDTETRDCLARLEGEIDTVAAADVWNAALAAHWSGPPVWVHGDLAPGNLLVQNGSLSAVIDFGSSAIGDPACDLVLPWTFLDGASRAAFIAAIDVDAGMWARARGWAIWKALLMRVKYSNPDKRAGEERIEDHRARG